MRNVHSNAANIATFVDDPLRFRDKLVADRDVGDWDLSYETSPQFDSRGAHRDA
jgi:hypothetical protein